MRSGRANALQIVVLHHQLTVLRRQIDQPERSPPTSDLDIAYGTATEAAEGGSELYAVGGLAHGMTSTSTRSRKYALIGCLMSWAVALAATVPDV